MGNTTMLAKINQFFQTLTEHQVSDKETLTQEMACAVLLCEVMRADHQFDEQEHQALTQLLNERFQLTTNELNELIAQALKQSDESNDLYFYTSLINQQFNIDEKKQLLTMLWSLAKADGNISSIEQHTIRKIADLLHLRHSEYIATKPKMSL